MLLGTKWNYRFILHTGTVAVVIICNYYLWVLSQLVSQYIMIFCRRCLKYFYAVQKNLLWKLLHLEICLLKTLMFISKKIEYNRCHLVSLLQTPVYCGDVAELVSDSTFRDLRACSFSVCWCSSLFIVQMALPYWCCRMLLGSQRNHVSLLNLVWIQTGNLQLWRLLTPLFWRLLTLLRSCLLQLVFPLFYELGWWLLI